MTTLIHPVSPEEIMASLDGELTAAEQQSVQSHVNQCTECAQISDQFRQTAAQLHSWTIEPLPPSFEEKIANHPGETSAPLHSSARRRPSSKLRSLRFALLSSGSLAAVFLLIVILSSGFRTRRMMFNLPENPASSAMNNDAASPMASRAHSLAIDAYAPARVDKDSRQVLAARTPTGGVLALNARPATTTPPLAVPMIARTVSLTIVVKNFTSSRGALDAFLALHHGYAAQLTVTTPESSSRSFQASLRVPAAELSSAIADIKSLGRVENETQSGEEVTQQHADLLARLKNARETEQRFQAILQQRTGKIEDVLQVEQEIARVRGEIETMEADQQNLEHRVEFASVDLQLTEEYQARLNAPTSPSVPTQLHNAMVSGYRHARNMTLAMLLFVAEAGPTLLMLLAIFGAPAFFLIRRYRRMRARLD